MCKVSLPLSALVQSISPRTNVHTIVVGEERHACVFPQPAPQSSHHRPSRQASPHPHHRLRRRQHQQRPKLLARLRSFTVSSPRAPCPPRLGDRPQAQAVGWLPYVAASFCMPPSKRATAHCKCSFTTGASSAAVSARSSGSTAGARELPSATAALRAMRSRPMRLRHPRGGGVTQTAPVSLRQWVSGSEFAWVESHGPARPPLSWKVASAIEA